MRLPKFLIIGAMKAGTTTLYEDLLSVPGLWLPPQKEPEDLADPKVETEAGLSDYARKYTACPRDCLAGDASTAYAKRPTFEGVASRAKRVIGPDVRIIYLTRDPIHRIVSHYHHLWGLEIENRPLNEAVRESREYVAYSRYNWQVTPWINEFGQENVKIVRFEDYLANRERELADLCNFLGVDLSINHTAQTHLNKSDGKRVPRRGSIIHRILQSNFYLFVLKPALSSTLRQRIKEAILPKARKMNETLSEETSQYLRRQLQTDKLASMYLPDKAE